MGKINCTGPIEEIPEKVLRMYDAVQQLIEEGESVSDIRVSAITERAGIGKGTAYEYFDTKEEILAGAFIYYVRLMVKRLNDEWMKMDTLREQINFLFDDLDKESQKKYYFVRFMHEVTGNTKFGNMVKEKLSASPDTRQFPVYLFGNIIHMGVERGEINGGIPVDYLIYTVFCKVLTYMMCICTEDCFDTDIRKLRSLIIEGILREMRG